MIKNFLFYEKWKPIVNLYHLDRIDRTEYGEYCHINFYYLNEKEPHCAWEFNSKSERDNIYSVFMEKITTKISLRYCFAFSDDWDVW